MANIDVEKLKEKLYPTASALFCISEVCVDVSKQHISAEDAIDKIRGYLGKAEMFSKHRVDRLIADCAVDEYIFTASKEALEKIPKGGVTRLVEAKERTKGYEKRI
jgi:hypothetical protein